MKKIIALVFIIILVSILTIQYREYNSIKYGEKNRSALSLRLKIAYYDTQFMSRVDNFDQLKSHPDMKPNVEAILAKYNFGFYRQIQKGVVYYYVLNKENSKNIQRNDLMSIHEIDFLKYLFHFEPIILDSVILDESQNLCFATTTDWTKIIFYKERKFVCDDSIFSTSVWGAFNKSLDVNGLKILSRFEMFEKESFQVIRTEVDSFGQLKSSLYCSSSTPHSNINHFIDSLDFYLNKIPKPMNLTVDSMYIKTSLLYPAEVN